MNEVIAIADRYGLFFSHAVAEDSNGTKIADGFYIYQPQRFSETFFTLFAKLSQLNNYCIHQLIACHRQLETIRVRKSECQSSISGSAEELIYLDEEIHDWNNNLEVTAKATAVVLLCSYVEWALRTISIELTGTLPGRKKSMQSAIDALVDNIRTRVDLATTSNLSGLQVIKEFRLVRNAFAHGDWEEVNRRIGDMSLRESFEAVSQFFEQIEEAAWRSSWGVEQVSR